MIAGTNSGVGKTTITMGLIAALRNRGRWVQPFKAGPDYIDPSYHTLAAGRACRNIDTWMVPPDRAVSLFHKASHQCDIAVIEGVMGVFDGFSYETEEGSSAQIAKLVGASVFLVIDVGKMARSVGAISLGYTRFDQGLNIAGFILNRCGSKNHYNGLKLAVEQSTGLPVVGWLPKDAQLHIPERHLGLVPTDERGELTEFINHAAQVIEQYFDLDKIEGGSQKSVASSQKSEISRQMLIANDKAQNPEAPTPDRQQILNPELRSLSSKNPINSIAVARDAAFSFYYEDNLDLLRENGVDITFFSPLQDKALPRNCCGVYLGGGFPEMFPAQLASNSTIKQALHQAYQAGMPIYAECGGFMYLTRAIIDLAGDKHDMVGLVPGLTRMQPRLMSLGYRVVESPTGNYLLPTGVTTRGHEFHWSRWETSDNDPMDASPAWLVQPRRGSESPQPNGYAQDNLIASYVHLHFAHNLILAKNFVTACQQWIQKS